MNIRIAICSVICAALLVGCDKGGGDTPAKPKRTVLTYVVASSLGEYISSNIDQMKSVAYNSNLNNGNLVVYYSENKRKSYLFQIKEDKKGQITTDTVRFYENQSAVSPETMRNVVQDVTELFPADSYGMILSSHGTSWLPSNYSSLRSFGEENNEYMEITEINEALNGFHFDFMLFDACYMSGIECAYELRERTDYMLGTPTEVLAQGFPYDNFLPALFEDEADLAAVAKSFYDYYSNNGNESYGTVSLVKSDELDSLAIVVNEILKDKTEEDIYALPLNEMQVLDYLTARSPHMLYDFDDFIQHLASGEQYERFSTYLNKAVVCKYATPYSYYSVVGAKEIEHYCGLSVFVPQPSLQKLTEWYKRLAWYTAVYN